MGTEINPNNTPTSKLPKTQQTNTNKTEPTGTEQVNASPTPTGNTNEYTPTDAPDTPIPSGTPYLGPSGTPTPGPSINIEINKGNKDDSTFDNLRTHFDGGKEDPPPTAKDSIPSIVFGTYKVGKVDIGGFFTDDFNAFGTTVRVKF